MPDAYRPNKRLLDDQEPAVRAYGEGKARTDDTQDSMRMLCWVWVSLLCVLSGLLYWWLYV